MMKTILSAFFGLFITFGSLQALAIDLQERVDGLIVKLHLQGDPVRAGSNHAEVMVMDASGKSLKNPKLKVYYGMRAMAGMPPMNFKSRLHSHKNHFTAQIDFKMKGQWDVKVKFKTADGKSHSVKMGVMVR